MAVKHYRMQAPVTSEHFITTSDAARIAGKSSETIRVWANSGRLAVAQRLPSGTRLYRAEDVLRASKGRTSASEDE